MVIGATAMFVHFQPQVLSHLLPSGDAQNGEESSVYSAYAGEETRQIKALSDQDIRGLLAGEGTPFGGMAKPGELNGYPGPRHVLDAHEAGEFAMSDEQHDRIEELYEEMRDLAVPLGGEIVEYERELDRAFVEKTITPDILEEIVEESAELYAELRYTHLRYHLELVNVLTPAQVQEYNELRGYLDGDVCSNIPPGHSEELWKLHNNCN